MIPYSPLLTDLYREIDRMGYDPTADMAQKLADHRFSELVDMVVVDMAKAGGRYQNDPFQRQPITIDHGWKPPTDHTKYAPAAKPKGNSNRAKAKAARKQNRGKK